MTHWCFHFKILTLLGSRVHKSFKYWPLWIERPTLCSISHSWQMSLLCRTAFFFNVTLILEATQEVISHNTNVISDPYKNYKTQCESRRKARIQKPHHPTKPPHHRRHPSQSIPLKFCRVPDAYSNSSCKTSPLAPTQTFCPPHPTFPFSKPEPSLHQKAMKTCMLASPEGQYCWIVIVIKQFWKALYHCYIQAKHWKTRFYV